MLELKRLKELQHDNITRFVGACLDPGKFYLSANKKNSVWMPVFSDGLAISIAID